MEKKERKTKAKRKRTKKKNKKTKKEERYEVETNLDKGIITLCRVEKSVSAIKERDKAKNRKKPYLTKEERIKRKGSKRRRKKRRNEEEEQGGS
jgi:hypothetical protein